MQRFVKMLLAAALLIVCAPFGLRHVQGELDREFNKRAARVETSSGRVGEVSIQIQGGSFVLRDLSLTGAAGSTILKGSLAGRTNRPPGQTTFEVKAYDREGNLLQGVEEKTIFTSHGRGPDSDQPINSGYGVWLQGIPLDAISRIEVSETSDGAFPLSAIPFADHALFSKEYSDIEE
ncbi:MAG TPA: hypothetical protein VEV81_02660 [Pyrinomonadaceae bacterium]|nr:hypothetical protein [Pyrinomonadaceae bacterium]